MSQRQLDEAVAKIRNEQISDETVKTAAKGVFGRLFDSAFVAGDPSGKIRGCRDVQALIPAYLNKSLSSARALLVEDHILQCVDCRRALNEARGGVSAAPVIPINQRRPKVPMLAWAAAAALAIGIALGLAGLLPGQRSINATVASVQGSLYRVTELGASLVEAGQIISSSDQLRTAKGSRAILRLASGMRLEIAERSEVSLSNRWRGAGVNLMRGQMIVDSAGAPRKALYVTTGDLTIPVTSGIVAVNHGTKDSRVAVARGFVDVATADSTSRVNAGQQFGGNARLLPISSEFAWSQNSEAYLGLLKELSDLQKEIQAIPSPDLRYESRLAQYLPADTYLYAAIPNLGGTITKAKELFDSRLSQSEALRQWWQQKSASKDGQFDKIVDQISALSGYLGNEIVITASGDAAGQHSGVVFLAEIVKPGLAEYLKTSLPAGSHVQIVTAGSPAAAGDGLLVELDNNVLVAATSAAHLQRVEQVVQKQAAGDFTRSPFFSRIARVYQTGAGYFLAANLEQITAKSVVNSKPLVPSGFENMQYVVLERKESNGDTEMKAAVSFDGARHGFASWLSAPGPAGSLDFVSPEANFATTMVMKNPRTMMQELIGFAGAKNADFQKGLDEFQAKAGLNLLDDIAGPLGSDVTFAFDGPLLPVPWKIAIEVYDPNRLQQTLQTFVDRFNQQASPKTGKLSLATEQVNGRAFYTLTSDKAPGLPAYYTFVDGYLLASSSTANIQTAIDNKRLRNTLANSPNFRDKLPADGYANFSAMVYTNVSKLGELAKQVQSSTSLNSDKQKNLSALLARSGQGLVCVYGESDRIVATARGSFLGFDLGTLVGIQQGQPLKTIIASAPMGVPGA